jgi:hypothetical protein
LERMKAGGVKKETISNNSYGLRSSFLLFSRFKNGTVE